MFISMPHFLIKERFEKSMAKTKTKFICHSCGYESAKWMGKCPGCGAWNTMVEETIKTRRQQKNRFFTFRSNSAKAFTSHFN